MSRKINILLLLIIMLTIISCDTMEHELDNITVTTADKGNDPTRGLIVGINTDKVPDIVISDLHLFFFDGNDKLVRHDYYDDMERLALTRMLFPNDRYTIFGVLNAGEGFSIDNFGIDNSFQPLDLPKFYIQDFILVMHQLEESNAYPSMLTAMKNAIVADNLKLVMLQFDELPAIKDITMLTLRLAYPSNHFPDYVANPNRSVPRTADLMLRVVMEVYKRDTKHKILRKTAFAQPTELDSVYIAELLLPKGEYDVRIWSDYSVAHDQDNHYITDKTNDVQIVDAEHYVGNTDTRDAFAKQTQVDVAGEPVQTHTVMMHRPLAKYQLITTDREEYEDARIQNGYPALEDLNIEIIYTGYFPAGYNMTVPALSASRLGYSYRGVVEEANDTTARIGKDMVLVNGSETFVTVAIVVRDLNNEVISSVSGIDIWYRAGHLTTIKGNFLTAIGGGGVTVDTSWDDDINVEF